MKRTTFFLCSILLTVISVLPLRVLATGSLDSAMTNLGQVGVQAGTTQGEISGVTGQVINAALTLVGIIFLLLMVYAGYLWMTARGEEDQITKAKKILSGTMIGLVIVLSAYAITKFVTTKFANTPTAPIAVTPSCQPVGSNARLGCRPPMCQGLQESACSGPRAPSDSNASCCQWVQ